MRKAERGPEPQRSEWDRGERGREEALERRFVAKPPRECECSHEGAQHAGEGE